MKELLFLDENKVTSEEKPSDESVGGGENLPSVTKDMSDQPSAADNQPSRFKNSFSEVVEVNVFKGIYIKTTFHEESCKKIRHK